MGQHFGRLSKMKVRDKEGDVTVTVFSFFFFVDILTTTTHFTHKKEMIAMGFNDSKQLDEKQREKLFQKMVNTPGLGWIVHSIPATEISGKMLRKEPYSLNAISHDSGTGGSVSIKALVTQRTNSRFVAFFFFPSMIAADLISLALAEGVCVTEVYVDTVGDPELYQMKLTSLFSHHTPEIKVSHMKKP